MNVLTNTDFLLQILQNLGKADKTTDEIFEEHLQNFNTQQVNATRLHKDINNYLRCIRGQYPSLYFVYLSAIFHFLINDPSLSFTASLCHAVTQFVMHQHPSKSD